MEVRRYAASRLLLRGGEVWSNAGVGLSPDGQVVELFRLDPNGCEPEGTKFFNGIMTAGFVNAHTHTELSFFDGVFVPGGSMVAFLRQIDSLRIDVNQERIDRALADCYATFEREGIVAYTDISNEADTVPFKASQSLRSVSFIEMFGANRTLADQAYAKGLEVLAHYHQAGIQAAYLTPHAPYSVSRELWDHLMPHLESAPIFSLHFAETPQEVEFMSQGTGAMAHLYRDVWRREVNLPRMDELLTTINRLGAMGKRILLIHCVAMTQEMMQRIGQASPQATLVLCPASNLFIEGAMPPLPLMRREGMRVAIGTDSLSSSPSLSILDQLRLLNRYFPEVPVMDLLRYATESGAEACGFEGLGVLEPGARAGLNVIEGPGVLDGDLSRSQLRPIASLVGILD